MDADRDDDVSSSSADLPAAPSSSDAEYVEAERMDGDESDAGGARFASGEEAQIRSFMFSVHGGGALKPPTVAAWICLLASWFFLGSRVPFTVFIGLPLNFAALVLGIVCLARGGIFTGLAVMVLGTAGSFLVYLVGLFRFLAIS